MSGPTGQPTTSSRKPFAALDVTRWLNGIGMGQYAQAFADNSVDGDALVRLKSRDLRALGVDLLGHRRKLLSAIARLAQGDEGTGRLPSDDLPP